MSRRSSSRAAAIGLLAGGAAGVMLYAVTIGIPHRTAHPEATGAIDPYRCQLLVTATTATSGGDVQTVALDCPGQQTLHLPGPYDTENALPAGLFRVPGWQVSQLLYVAGEVRLQLLDDTQNCLLRMSVTSLERPGTHVTCTLRTLQAPAPPSPIPATPARPSATPTSRTA